MGRNYRKLILLEGVVACGVINFFFFSTLNCNGAESPPPVCSRKPTRGE